MVRAKAARQAGFAELRIAEDFVFVARLLCQPGEIVPVDAPSVCYVDAPDRQTWREYHHRDQMRAAGRAILAPLDADHPVRAHAGTVEAAFEAAIARACFRLGDTRSGWTALMRARRLDHRLPGSRLRPWKIVRSLLRRPASEAAGARGGGTRQGA
jgi:hypothetical protein